ncbi:outer membrane lipoprotein chaperone LolA, partial [Leisingera sp. F5]|uniref:outer membrane lipoprotein chaperone LolA n=1 Tax=Leisingera sp. F5 TaxID=1813816 RepID=UPI000A4F3379
MRNVLKIKVVFCLSLLMLAFVGKANADVDASQRLHDLLKNMQSFQADFIQNVLNTNGVLQQSTQGEMAVKRPGLFYWQTFAPFEQTLVADGEQLWSYDPDLEQVTVQAVGQRLSDTPALLFSGEIDGLTDSYAISAVQLKDESWQFRLLPKQPDSLFEELRLTFAFDTLTQMHILDSLGNRSS